MERGWLKRKLKFLDWSSSLNLSSQKPGRFLVSPALMKTEMRREQGTSGAAVISNLIFLLMIVGCLRGSKGTCSLSYLAWLGRHTWTQMLQTKEAESLRECKLNSSCHLGSLMLCLLI